MQELILIKPNCSPEPYDLLTRQAERDVPAFLSWGVLGILGIYVPGQDLIGEF